MSFSDAAHARTIEQIEQSINLPQTMQILDSIQDIIGIQLPDHRIIAYNKAGYEFLHLTHEQVRGKHCYELIGRISPCVPCTTAMALQTGTPSESERYIPEIEKYVHVRCTPVFDDDGAIIYLIEQLSDITARKKTEQLLAGQSARYRSLVEDSPYGFMIIQGGRITYANTWVTGLFEHGITAEADATIESFLALVQTDDRERVREAIDSCRDDCNLSALIPCAITGPNGMLRAIEIHFSRMLFEGRPACQCFIEEVTHTTESNHSRRQNQAKYLRIFNNLQDVYYETDLDGTILEISPSIEVFSQYTRNDLIGKNVSELYNTPEHRDSLLEEISVTGRLEDYEVVFVDADGEQVDCSVNSLLITDPDDGARRIVGSLRVITDRKRLERRLAKLVEEKETLIREVHHRVKNNMQVITGLLYLQAEQAHNPDYAKLLHESVSRIEAMSMIHELLHRSEALDAVDMGEYLKNLTATIRTLYRGDSSGIGISITTRGISLSMDQAIPCGLVVTELISNAFKHGFKYTDKGTISIVLNHHDDERLKLTISHNGAGIPADFDWRHAPSLGLKLAIMLTEHQLNGTLELTSPEQSLFTLIFTR